MVFEELLSQKSTYITYKKCQIKTIEKQNFWKFGRILNFILLLIKDLWKWVLAVNDR